jgi:hypothetical protein
VLGLRITAELADIVARCLAKLPEHRFADARALGEALDSLKFRDRQGILGR